MLFLVVSIVLGLFEQNRQLTLVDDQITTASMVLKDQNPALYPQDPTFSDGRYRIYIPALRAIINFATQLAGNNIEAGHRLLVPLILFVFLCSFYILLVSLTNNPGLSALISILAALQRPIMPSTFWGVWGLSSLYARSFFLAFLPLVIWLFWRWRSSWRVVWVFLLLGIISNLHPTGGYVMTPMLMLTLLLDRGLSQRAIGQILVGGTLALLGISPFVWDYLQYPRELLVGSDFLGGAVGLYPVDPARFQGQGYAFPIPWHTIRDSILIGGDVSMLAALAWLTRWRRKEPVDRFLLWLALAVLAVSFGGTAITQAFGWLRGNPVWYSEMMRGLRFIYLPLFAEVALLFGDLKQLIRYNKLRNFYILVLVVMMLLFPAMPFLQFRRIQYQKRQISDPEKASQTIQVSFDWAYNHITRGLPDNLAVPLTAAMVKISPDQAKRLLVQAHTEDRDYAEIAEWTLSHTSPTERILIENPHFRIKTQRELGEQIIPDAVPPDIKICYQNYDPDCLVTAAATHRAGYIITRQSFSALSLPLVFENSTYRIYVVDN
jgi:hypothetical protein